MARKLAAFLLALSMLGGGQTSAQTIWNEDGLGAEIKTYISDFNDGSLQNIINTVPTVGSIRNQESYNGSHLRIRDKDVSDRDKYVELGPGQTDNPQFFFLFPEVMYGKVVIEADLKMDNLTPTRNLFEVVTHDEQSLFCLSAQGYYYQLYYERTNTDVNEIPVNDEWHHYMAVVDTEENTFMMYIDGRPCFARPAAANRGADAQKGISGFKSTITYLPTRGEAESTGTTGIDNIKVYSIDREPYTDLDSECFLFDYDYYTVSGIRKGSTAGEVLEEINLHGAEAFIMDYNGQSRELDDFVGQRDTLVVTAGRRRTFYSIRLEENKIAELLMMVGSPEAFADGERKQIADDNAQVCPMQIDGTVYIPVRVLKQFFGAQVFHERRDNSVKILLGEREIKLQADSGEYFVNGAGSKMEGVPFYCMDEFYAPMTELAETLGLKAKADYDGLLFMDKKEITEITGQRRRQYLINGFLMRENKADSAVIRPVNGNIQKAVEQAAILWKDGLNTDIVIDLGTQEYKITDTIQIPHIPAQGKNRLILRGNAKEHAVLNGGMRLDQTLFRPVSDDAPIKRRFPQISADKILMCSLGELGIEDVGKIYPQGHTFEIKPSEMKLFVDGERQTMARYPNTGFVYTGNVLHGGFGNPANGYGENEFEYVDKRVENWQIDENTWMFGYWNNEYSTSDAKLKSVSLEKNSITVQGPVRGAMKAAERPYYYYNILEELDQPGEYFLDMNTKTIYFYPSVEFYRNKNYISFTDKTLLELEHAENVTLENIDFSYTRDMAVKVFQGKNTLIRNCAFIGIGTYGVMQRQCENSGLYGCYFYDTGAHSAMIEGGDLFTLTKSGNFVMNCKFRETGTRRKTYSGSILTRGCGNWIYKNRIQDGYHMGIYVFGAQHTMEYNSFSNMCYLSGDAGCIYMAGNWATAGTRVIGNYFENMSPHPEVHAGGNVAVYYDNSTSHTTTYGNIIYDTVYGVQSNCGRYNQIYGNLMCDIKNQAGIIGADENGSFQSPYDTLRMIPYDGEIWRKTLPLLAQLRDNYNPKEPIGSDAFNNIWENTRSFSVTKPKITKIYNNISNNDETKSLFMDKDVKDFRIANQSFFKNTYIDGSIDYFSMGVGDDFQFGKQDSLERLFIETDISNTSMANIYLAPGERIATYVKGRNADGDVQDMDKIRIVYSMDHPEIVSCDADGMLQANREGSAELTVTAILRGKTICTRLRIYTDAAAWEKENQVMADRPVHVFYNDKEINLDPGCYTEQGALFIPAAQVFEKMGYQTDLQDKNVIFSREGETVSFSGDDSVFRQNDKEIAMTDPARVRNGQLYVPFSIFEDLGLLSLYDDAEQTAKIYRVNMASGSERIPERAEIVQLGELISDSAAWTQDITARYFNTGSMIRFGVDSAGGKQNILGYQKEKLTQNCMLAFECEWKSDTFVAIAMRVGDPTAIPWRTVDTGSYYVIIKPDTIEVQKRIDGQTTYIVDNVPNEYLRRGESHAVSMGIVDTEEGQRIILNADGHNIIDVVDKINYSVSGNTRQIAAEALRPVKEAGYISFIVYSTVANENDAYMEIK